MITDRIFKVFTYDMGVDFGTANTLFYVVGKGIAVREPTVVARQKKGKHIVAVGEEAKKMIGRTPGQLETIRPLKHGVISDFDGAAGLLTYFVKQLHQSHGLQIKIPRPRLVVSIPMGVTDVEKKAVRDAAFEAGAREVYLVEEPMAAAIGAGLPIFEAAGALVVALGGGTSELAVISLGGVVIGKSLRLAGDDLDEAIISFIRLKYSVLIGLPSAEMLKIAIGSVVGELGGEEKLAVVRGRDLATGLPRSLRVNAGEAREAMSPILNRIAFEVTELLEEVPPELLGDIGQKGIYLAGGTAQLPGIDKLITEVTKMACYVIEEPQTVVARGCGRLLEDFDLFKKVKAAGGVK